MKIIIRADSSNIIGSGHIMRTLVLAHKFKDMGHEVSYICATLPDNISSHVEKEGFKLFKLDYKSDAKNWIDWQYDLAQITPILESEKADLLIVDHYLLGVEWEQKVRQFVNKIVVIDDYLDRKHDSDIFLNQNFSDSEKQNLDDNLPAKCIQVLGPKYAILREEFLNANRKQQPVGDIKNIVISFGGTDSLNLSEKILRFFTKNPEYSNININCVIGWQNHNKEKIKALCDSNSNFFYHCQIDYMAKLLSEADLCIGAGGSSSWERLYIGVPSIIVSLAENQDAICQWLYKNKLSYYIGKAEDFSEEVLRNAIDTIANDSIWRQTAINLGQKTVDGLGIDRIIDCINSLAAK